MCYMKRTLSNKKAIVANEPKTKQPIVSAKTVKPVEKKTIVSTPKIKPPTKKIKSINLAEKSSLKNQNLASPVSAQKTKSAKIKKPTTASVNSIKPPIKNVKPAVSIKAKTKSAKPQPIVSAKKSNAESVKLKTVKNKVQKPELSKIIKTKSQEIKPTSPRVKTAPSENKIKPKNVKLTNKIQTTPIVEAVENKVAPKPRKKKAKPIGSAIFRGKKERYGFEVFPLDAEFEDVSAIYVISKRKIDKRKKGHHALVCIGQTESVLGEIKRHKKGKCVKKYQANVISILPEENEQKRLRIETDLKAAHTVVCTLE